MIMIFPSPILPDPPDLHEHTIPWMFFLSLFEIEINKMPTNQTKQLTYLSLSLTHMHKHRHTCIYPYIHAHIHKL